MRDFTKTAEPSGDTPAVLGHRFVVQKHAARRLHYDFSTASCCRGRCRRGRACRPRIAGSINYADFEGVIPDGEYGGGTVVVWDRGTWTPEGDPHAQLAKGRLTFSLAPFSPRARPNAPVAVPITERPGLHRTIRPPAMSARAPASSARRTRGSRAGTTRS
jgi:hypothetical protein